MLEVAARPIGGLCSRVLTFEDSRHADWKTCSNVLLARRRRTSIAACTREAAAAAVMMIPIPARGMYKGVHG